MLFLKRASDLFDQRQAELRKQFKAQGMSEDDTELALNDPDHYSGKYFYVPPRARWNQGWEEEVVEDGEKGDSASSAQTHQGKCRHYAE